MMGIKEFYLKYKRYIDLFGYLFIIIVFRPVGKFWLTILALLMFSVIINYSKIKEQVLIQRDLISSAWQQRK